MTSEWVKLPVTLAELDAIISRTRAEERALAQRMQAEASERAYADGQRSMIGPNPGTVQIEEAFERGLQSVLDRLNNPDEALHRAVSNASGRFTPESTARICRALADALEASPTRTETE